MNITLNSLHLSDIRFLKMQSKTGLEPLYLLAILGFMRESFKASGVRQGTQDELSMHILVPEDKANKVFHALVEAGYLSPKDDGIYCVNFGTDTPREPTKKAPAKKKKITKTKAKSPIFASKPDIILNESQTAPLCIVPPHQNRPTPKDGETLAKAARNATWEAYKAGYIQRYRVDPLRNAKSNALIKQFTERVGHEYSAAVITFYTGHNAGRYQELLHPLTMAVKDAEALYAQWVRNRQMTSQQARQSEQMAYAQDQIARIERGEI